MLHAGKYLNVIRECGRLDIKNPYEDLTSADGFSFTKVAIENMISSEQQAAGSQGKGDIMMNDETAENGGAGVGVGVEEERKGDQSAV